MGHQLSKLNDTPALGSYWSITSLYSIVPSLGEPSYSLVTSLSYLALNKDIIPNPAEEEGARASNIQLVIKYPSFSWEGNQYENFKTFKSRTTILMEGPYKSDTVSVRNQWSPGVIVERVHDRSYTVISQKGRMLSRNRVDLKPYHKEVTITYEPPKSPSSPFDMPSRQTNIQTQTEKIPHHIHHPNQRPKWFTPEWLTPWVTTNHHHRQTDIATGITRNHHHTHLNTHHIVTHHQLYHKKVITRHQVLDA